MTNTKSEQVEWRRNKVQELVVKGFRQHEIVQMLQLNKSTICKDISFMNAQARETIKNHISDKLPFEFIKAMQGYDEILKTCWIIGARTEKEGDTKTHLQALALIADTYSRKMDLLTNAGLLQDSVKWIEQTKEKILKNKGNDVQGLSETNRTEPEPAAV